MSGRSYRLDLWAYTTGRPSGKNNYGDQIEDFSFTTTAPGGFGDFTAKIRTSDAFNVPPELRLFANVAVQADGFTLFAGRWDEPGIGLDNTDGDVWNLHAMGGADALKDDPEDASYATKTAFQILTDQLSGPTGITPARSGYISIDQDTAAILPDNPAGTYSPAFNAQTFEQVLNSQLPLVGDYTWGAWDHPTHRDASGFPTWQLRVHKRDTTTVAYTAYPEDIETIDVRPSVEYSYNVIRVKYRDASTDASSSVTVTDSRLNANGTQGTAPIPRREMVKDLTASHLTATEAAAIANALLAQYQNGGFKISIDLTRVRDANGNEIPLWQCRADANILLPPVTLSGTILPAAATTNVNLFYIFQTAYSEQSGQEPKLTLTLDSFEDKASFQIARLQYIAEQRSNDGKVHQTVRAAGEPETGKCGVSWPSSATAGQAYEQGVNYKTNLSAIPTSIALTTTSSLNVSGTPTTYDVGISGFQLQAVVLANGAGKWSGTYQTVGN